MKLKDCTMCGCALTDMFACAACDAADAVIAAGGALPHYQEALAVQIGNVLAQRDWCAKPINLDHMFPGVNFPRFR
jgi:hypothetical protein